jgi:putative transcriptional regulator
MKKKKCLSDEDFAELRLSLEQALQLSQAVFARVLNVSVRTVQAWEQGLRQPSDAALKLLTIAKKRPEGLLA